MEEITFDFSLKEDGIELANSLLRTWSKTLSDEEGEDVWQAIAPKLRGGSRFDLDKFLSILSESIPYYPYLLDENSTPRQAYYSRIGLIFNKMLIKNSTASQFGIIFHIANKIRENLDLIWESEDYVNLDEEFAKEFKNFATYYNIIPFYSSIIHDLTLGSGVTRVTRRDERQYERIDEMLEVIMCICRAILTRKWSVVLLGKLIAHVGKLRFKEQNAKKICKIYKAINPMKKNISCENILCFKTGDYATQPIALDDNELNAWDISSIISEENANFHEIMNKVRNISDNFTMKLWKI